MTIDGLTLRTVTQELDEKLRNGKIQKVLMPGKEEISLLVYSAAEGTMRLVISADAGDSAIYLTKHSKENPKNAPAFCMFLRKHLTGAIIRHVEQSGLDRVVTLYLETKDELFRPVQLRLIAEVMGKYSNIILADGGGRILDSIKRVSADMSRMRTVLPGIPYEHPPQQKSDPLALSVDEIMSVLRTSDDTRIDRRLPSVLDGVSKQTAEEIISRAGLEKRFTSLFTDEDYRLLSETVHDFFTEAIARPNPSVQLNVDGAPVFFSLVPYRAYPAQSRVQFDNANNMVDYFYSRRSELLRVAQSRNALQKTIGKLLQKLERRIQVYEASLRDASRAQAEQQKADLIIANLYRLTKGMTRFTAQTFDTGAEVVIELDPSRTPSEMAQRLYKRIAKFKRAAELNTIKLNDAREERDFLLGALMYAEEASSLREISEIKDSLADAGYMPKPRVRRKISDTEDSKPLKFISPSGYTVYVGRNDRQNEHLTHRMSRKEDIWFHAQKIPGSHVILETGGTLLEDIDDETVVFAARLAAQHSRARRSGKTPVDYTQRRNVKKPPKSRPGKVIYDDYYTVYVEANTSDATVTANRD